MAGSRPYHEVPASLQHASVIVVPHVVTPFTDSLDPIKARECLAVGRPTVAPSIAGFRDIGPPVVVAERSTFTGTVLDTMLATGSRESPPPPGARRSPDGRFVRAPATWAEQGRAFGAVLDRAAGRRDRS